MRPKLSLLILVLVLTVGCAQLHEARRTAAPSRFTRVHIIVYCYRQQGDDLVFNAAAFQFLKNCLRDYVEKQLTDQGFQVQYIWAQAFQGEINDYKHAKLIVNYIESKGETAYDSPLVHPGPIGFNTQIVVSMKLISPTGVLLWQKTLRAATSRAVYIYNYMHRLEELRKPDQQQTLDQDARENMEKQFKMLEITIRKFRKRRELQ